MNSDPTVMQSIAAVTAQEVRATDFDIFRREEMAILDTHDRLIKVHITEAFTSMIRFKGSVAADQFLSGALYATRLLRILGVSSMSPGSLDHEFSSGMGALDFQDAKEDKLFEDVFGSNLELTAAAEQFSNPNAKQGAYMVFFMHLDVIPGANRLSGLVND